MNYTEFPGLNNVIFFPLESPQMNLVQISLNSDDCFSGGNFSFFLEKEFLVCICIKPNLIFFLGGGVQKSKLLRMS